MRRFLGQPNSQVTQAVRTYGTLPNILETYGSLCFNFKTMKNYLDHKTFSEVANVFEKKKQFPQDLAEKFAAGAHTWALDNGVTHYTHVFQPLSGVLGEKHDVMFGADEAGKVKSELTAKQILSSEPDASSFPNGGLRQTNKARGNAIWDPQSHLTISRMGDASCLRIPSVFIGWTGEALDYKTPLLRSERALERATFRVLNLLGETGHYRVDASCGLEQEFFLIEEKLFNKRPDLVVCGRTLLGRDPSRGQDHSDRYFGWQSTKMQDAIFEMEQEFWKLGIKNNTRQREVAPGQYEMAPRFDYANQANDNNMVMMQVMREVAKRHGLACILHEKPFANLNGSGKHNNWSFGTNKDKSFFKPNSPFFMIATAAFTRGVSLHGGLLRASVATAGNDHRLGGHEAPPGIMSIYTGEDVEDMIERCSRGEDYTYINLTCKAHDFGVDYLPNFPREASDRNRTSPIAFCGNRFEFRATGSSVNTAWPTTILNTITTESLNYIADQLESAKSSVTPALVDKVLQKIFTEHKHAIYCGDNYSDDWKKEAASRGLINAVDTPAALPYVTSPESIKLFTSLGVLSESELRARSNVFYSNFNLDVGVELRCLLDMCTQHVIPSTYRQLSYIKDDVKGVEGHSKYVNEIKTHLGKLLEKVEQLNEVDKELSKLDSVERANVIKTKGRPAMKAIRVHADTLEGLVDAALWTLPSYQQMIHEGH